MSKSVTIHRHDFVKLLPAVRCAMESVLLAPLSEEAFMLQFGLLCIEVTKETITIIDRNE